MICRLRGALPLPLQADDEGGEDWRSARLAPGLRLLVRERLSLLRHGLSLHSPGPLHHGERLPAGPGRVPQDGQVRPRPHQQRRGGPERGGARESPAGQAAAGARAGGAGARGRDLLPLQPPAHLRPEPQSQQEVVHDLRLQRQVRGREENNY